MEDEQFIKLRQKITHNYKTLKEVYGSPLYGIKTGLTEAFVINHEQYARLKTDDPNGQILKPFLEGKDLKRWRAESRDLYLILFPKGWTHEQLRPKTDNENLSEEVTALEEPEAWAYVQKNYPNIAEHLSSYATQGRKRGDKGDFWWELRACSYYEKFEESKVLYPEFSVSRKFHLNNQELYTNNKAFLIPSADYYLVGLLNSSSIWFVLTGICTNVRGGFYELRSNKIETLPIPTASPEQQKTIADLAEKCQANAKDRYELEQKVQRRFIENLRPANNVESLNTKLNQWWKLATVTDLATEARKAFKLKKSETLKVDLTDPNKQDAWEKLLKDNTQTWQDYTKTINSLEQQINTAVYALFKLSPEEINLIEKTKP